jgi:hypothetical protein
MLTWFKRLFLGDDRLFLMGSHMARVLRDDAFHGVPDIGSTDKANSCILVLDYERDGYVRLTNRQEESCKHGQQT